MSDFIQCDRCDNEADTHTKPQTNYYETLCPSCLEMDGVISKLDSSIAEMLDALELRPSDYNTALELKQSEDKLNKLYDEFTN